MKNLSSRKKISYFGILVTIIFSAYLNFGAGKSLAVVFPPDWGWFSVGPEGISHQQAGNAQTLPSTTNPAAATTTVTVNFRQPMVEFFKASPSTITPSQSSTLSWSVTDATRVFIDGIGEVGAHGSVVVTPNKTTTYTLRAENSSVRQSAAVPVQSVQSATINLGPNTQTTLTTSGNAPAYVNDPGATGWTWFRIGN